MSTRWHVHFTGWQRVAWALDEDLRWARTALRNRATSVPLPLARVVHAAWWPAIEQIGVAALGNRKVLCFADNPPAFYVTQPGFAAVSRRVDLWLARSQEAVAQFRTLGLPVEFVPYCADPEVFKPLDERYSIRRQFNIPENAFVIGNFHRDSEASNLGAPKRQKGPDILFEIARSLHDRLPNLLVLLAGPRRHWLLRRLEERAIPFRFVGEKPEGRDDYERNIQDRTALNRLYQALDVCVVSSRWEGGPHTVLEAILAGRPLISTPVGIARDLLPPGHLFRSVDEAVSLLEEHARTHTLFRGGGVRRGRVLREYSLEALRERLAAVYAPLPTGPNEPAEILGSACRLLHARLRRPRWQEVPPDDPARRMSEASCRGLVPDARLPHYDSENPAGDWEAFLTYAARIRQAQG